MSQVKKETTAPKLTGEQIVQKKLDEVNAMLKKMDPAQLELLKTGKSIQLND